MIPHHCNIEKKDNSTNEKVVPKPQKLSTESGQKPPRSLMKTNPTNADFENKKYLNVQQNKAYRSSVWIAIVTVLLMSNYEWMKHLLRF